MSLLLAFALLPVAGYLSWTAELSPARRRIAAVLGAVALALLIVG